MAGWAVIIVLFVTIVLVYIPLIISNHNKFEFEFFYFGVTSGVLQSITIQNNIKKLAEPKNGECVFT